MKFFILFLALLLSFSFGACTKQKYETLKSVKSPGGKVDAFLLRQGGHAFESFVYELHLQPAGSTSGFGEQTLRLKAHCVSGIEIAWASDRLLQVKFQKAKITNYLNSWQSKEMDGFKSEIEIRLLPLAESSFDP